MADRAKHSREVHDGQGSREIKTRDGGDAPDEEAGYPEIEGGVWGITQFRSTITEVKPVSILSGSAATRGRKRS